MKYEARLAELGLTLPAAPRLPAAIQPNFAWVRLAGNRAYVSGHGPQNPDGSIAEPLGAVGAAVTAEQAYHAAALAALSMLGSLQRALGDLDRIGAWLRVEGYVLVAPGFTGTTNVVNGCSDLLLRIFGHEVGEHARTAMGVAATPLNCPVVLAAEVALL